MLSEQELEWLERRKNRCNRCARRGYCHFGNKHGFNTETCRFWEVINPKGEILVRNYFRESAEFEALVAVELAQNEHRFVPCYKSEIEWNDCPHEGWDCNQCRIKYARLAVEAEIDK